VTDAEIDSLQNYLTGRYSVQIHLSRGVDSVILGLVGDTAHVDIEAVAAQDIVERVTRVGEPYKKVNRKFHPDDTIVTVGGFPIGGKQFAVIAGPCSVETEPQITEVAERVKSAGAQFLRGGAYKPRTSPYSFQGLGAEGIDLLIKAREKTGLPIVSEIMSSDALHDFDDVDIIQVGARNMQNFSLLKLLGTFGKPVLLKRGLANTIEEWLMSAEYIMASGNENVILCERGIRTFETATRNTLDISAIPLVKKLSHLPVIVDPTHASGIPWLVEPLTMASIAAGADGIMIEVHNDPPRALSDGAQALTPDQFDAVSARMREVAPVFGRTI
jgi:3-deoxy-7-phosphoheptulonate synthase